MSFLGKVFGFKKKVKYSQDTQFKMCVIDETSNKVYTMLGITDERAEELTKLVLKSYEDNNN